MIPRVTETFKFRNDFAEQIFNEKYRHEGAETWPQLAKTLVEHVMGGLPISLEVKEQTARFITEMKFIPGGRYLYYAGRPKPFFNNCYLLRSEEDTREDWAELSWKAESCLLTGGGIGNDYSRYRPKGSLIRRTGGAASGPIPKMMMINDIGRYVMQGGSRRSAIYASLNWQHQDAAELLTTKDWDSQIVGSSGVSIGDLKRADFNFHAPLDMTNISLNYDDTWLKNEPEKNPLFLEHVRMALTNGEPGFSFNFGKHRKETLRNACTEVTSEDDSDVCNLGSLNMSRIETLEEFGEVIDLATLFLLCGTLVAELPYAKVYQVREKNRRLGLGLMGIHEWLIQRGKRYEVDDELRTWFNIYRDTSNSASRRYADRFNVSRPIANRAVAPTGSIGILAGTTSGIEPVYATAYIRRFLTKGTRWKEEYRIDDIALEMQKQYGIDPDTIETAASLASEPERRIKFQADLQDFVDMGISSTINLPAKADQKFTEGDFASLLASYAGRLRGITTYPDGSRGGQPLRAVSFVEAQKKLGEKLNDNVETNDVCLLTGGGHCGV